MKRNTSVVTTSQVHLSLSLCVSLKGKRMKHQRAVKIWAPSCEEAHDGGGDLHIEARSLIAAPHSMARPRERGEGGATGRKQERRPYMVVVVDLW